MPQRICRNRGEPVSFAPRSAPGAGRGTSESCPRGRRGSPAKGVWGQKLHRGFESLTLRHCLDPSEHAASFRRKSSRQALTGIRAACRIPLLFHAPVAQLDRAPGYELGGRRFESFRARQNRKSRRPMGAPHWPFCFAVVRAEGALRASKKQDPASLAFDARKAQWLALRPAAVDRHVGACCQALRSIRRVWSWQRQPTARRVPACRRGGPRHAPRRR